MAEYKGYMLQYAMLFGTYMGGYWILKFVFFPLGMSVPILMFLFWGLTLAVPFMGFRYTKMYRNQVLGGGIGFLQAWAFNVMMYMFAALLVAVAHYIYFRFLDNGFIFRTWEAMLDSVATGGVPDIEMYIKQLKENIDLIRSLTPIELTMQLMSQNVFFGTLLGLPTALFVMKKRNNLQLNNQ